MKTTRILLITGNQAYQDIRDINFKSINPDLEISIHKIEIDIAAFITPTLLENALMNYNQEDFDYAIIPGLIKWDISKIKSPFKSIIKKGPQFIADIEELLKWGRFEKLSTIEPANKIYSEHTIADLNKVRNQLTHELISSGEFEAEGFFLSEKYNRIIFHPNLQPIILGEIVDAPLKSLNKLKNEIKNYIDHGANIIDLGAIAGADNSHFFQELIPVLQESFDIPFSIDSLNPNEIINAVNAGAQMILSITFDNYKQIIEEESISKDIPIVILPISFKEYIPKEKYLNPKFIITRLFELGNIMAQEGFKKIFLDPIMHTPINPGISSSLETLFLLHQTIKTLPTRDEGGIIINKPHLFMGAGNITELIDADSSGINAMLALIAIENNITGILTTEYSKKCRYSIKELKKALELSFYAKTKNLPPINLGIDSFRFKSKKGTPKYRDYGEEKEIISAELDPANMDTKGYFKIGLNLEDNLLFATHFTNENLATKTFLGNNAESIYKEIIQNGLISRMDHAAYLGKELIQAELALDKGLMYQQD